MTARAQTRSIKRTTTLAKKLAPARTKQTAAPRLKPIGTRQTRLELIATVAADSGIEARVVDRVARSLSKTLTRHLVKNGSGRVEIPYLGAALWRGQQAAQKPRKMASPILNGRIITIPGRRACSAPRLRAHAALREIVART